MRLGWRRIGRPQVFVLDLSPCIDTGLSLLTMRVLFARWLAIT